MFFFLAHLAQRAKVNTGIVNTLHLLSYFILLSVNFSHFIPILTNQWTKETKTFSSPPPPSFSYSLDPPLLYSLYVIVSFQQVLKSKNFFSNGFSSVLLLVILTNSSYLLVMLSLACQS